MMVHDERMPFNGEDNMMFDLAIIGFSSEPQSPVKEVLTLGKAYGLNLCYFALADFSPQAMPSVRQATYWSGTTFFTVSLNRLPCFCETRFSLRSQYLAPYQEQMDAIFSQTTLTEYGALPKFRLSRAILNSPELSQYGIPTFDLRSFDDFQNYANTLKRCIIKPSAGRKGYFVYQIGHDDSMLYFLKDSEKVFITEAVWEDYRKNLREGQLGIPILQPRLNFQFEGRSVDFRLLVQRGGTGEWEKVAIYARIGESDTVSNLAQGGFVADPMTVLASVAPGREEELYQELEYLCLAVPKLIQSKLEKPVACLGIDVGIDCDTLQLYVIEANTFPGTKYHTWDLAHKKVQYYKYLIDKQRIAANFKEKIEHLIE